MLITRQLSLRLRRAVCACAAWLAWGVPAQTVPEFHLQVLGSSVTSAQFSRWEQPFWTQTLPTLSAGRFQAEVVPFDVAGVPASDMLQMLQLGVVAFGTTPLSALTAQYPQFTALDLAGLYPDVDSLRQRLITLRPYLETALREQLGVELLALGIRPAQVLYCKTPLRRLADVRGRSVRVASASQADLLGALGADVLVVSVPQTPAMLAGVHNDCLVASAALAPPHAQGPFMLALPLSWGVSFLGANGAAWAALPGALRALLRQELPKLEQAEWVDAQSRTQAVLDCARQDCAARVGAAPLLAPGPGSVRSQLADLPTRVVLSQWQRRCGLPCVVLWEQTLAPQSAALPP